VARHLGFTEQVARIGVPCDEAQRPVFAGSADEDRDPLLDGSPTGSSKPLTSASQAIVVRWPAISVASPGKVKLEIEGPNRGGIGASFWDVTR